MEAIYNIMIDDKTEASWPLSLEMMYQYFEKESGLEREEICKRLEIKTPIEKYGARPKRRNWGRGVE